MWLHHNRCRVPCSRSDRDRVWFILTCLNARAALRESRLIKSECSWKIQRQRHFFVGSSKHWPVSRSKLSFPLGVSTNRVLQFSHGAEPIHLHQSSFYSWMENWLCLCSSVCGLITLVFLYSDHSIKPLWCILVGKGLLFFCLITLLIAQLFHYKSNNEYPYAS